MVFQVLAPFIPVGVCIAKTVRNASHASAGGREKKLEANNVRTQSVIDRLTAGNSGAPIAYWSEQHLERMMKTNSAFKLHADELRDAHKATRV